MFLVPDPGASHLPDGLQAPLSRPHRGTAGCSLVLRERTTDTLFCAATVCMRAQKEAGKHVGVFRGQEEKDYKEVVAAQHLLPGRARGHAQHCRGRREPARLLTQPRSSGSPGVPQERQAALCHERSLSPGGGEPEWSGGLEAQCPQPQARVPSL